MIENGGWVATGISLKVYIELRDVLVFVASAGFVRRVAFVSI
jgi:hypothetical protein